MQKDFIRIILTVLVFITIAGCKTTKKTVMPEKQTEAQLLLTEIRKAEPKFTNIEFKRMNIGISLNEKTRYNSVATCKIIPDSVIHISVQPFFGVEMFIARLTPEQILVIDKIKGIYYQSDYSIFEQQFGIAINYLTFESLFTNKLFFINKTNHIDPVLMNATEKSGSKMLSYQHATLNQHFFLNENYRIREMAVNSNSGNEQFMAFYSDFTQNGNLTFPYGIRFQLKNKTELYSLNMSISRFAVDENITIPALNLSQYRQGNISSLIK
ncbi:hypothetical protein SDC9_34887 [bioreactor metagenome]|jgi:hypothetical protein|uniref:DUF4292 domain-containing protein n=1 Tax=bioreactor metagenome TaxID=1076179 RepID=A0A644VC00_9ZZZZ